MPVFTPNMSVSPREELALAIVEGEGAVKNLIAEQIMPSFPLTRKTAHLPKLTLAGSQGMRMIADKKFLRAPGTRYERMVATISDATIFTNLRGCEIVIPNETEMEWAGYMDLVSFFMSRFGTEYSGLTKEFLVAQTVFDPSNTFAGVAINASVAYTAGAAKIEGALGMDPIGDIIAATRYGKSIGEAYDTVAMSGPQWERVRTCYNVLKFVKGMFAGITEVTQDNFLGALRPFGIQKVLVGDTYYNNAADGQTPSLLQLWSNTYIAVLRAGNASVPSEDNAVGVPTLSGLGVNAYWTGFAPGGVPKVDGDLTMSGGNYVETYPSKEINSMVVRVGMSSNPFIGNNRCLTLIATGYVA